MTHFVMSKDMATFKQGYLHIKRERQSPAVTSVLFKVTFFISFSKKQVNILLVLFNGYHIQTSFFSGFMSPFLITEAMQSSGGVL